MKVPDKPRFSQSTCEDKDELMAIISAGAERVFIQTTTIMKGDVQDLDSNIAFLKSNFRDHFVSYKRILTGSSQRTSR